MPAQGAPGWWAACSARATAAASSRSAGVGRHRRQGAVGQGRPQGLLPPRPAGQDGVGDGQHLGGRAVVLLQADDAGAGEVAGEVDQVSRRRRR